MNISKDATIHSPEIQAINKKIMRIVIMSQMLGGAGLAAGITVGTLIAAQMLGTDRYAGVPVALFTAGSAIGALVVGKITQQRGRRLGLSSGFFLGGIGALLIILSTVIDSIPLLFLALIVYGFGTSTNLQARYAATDLALPNKRATAVSIAMVSTTLGAVVGPNLVTPMSFVAKAIGIPELAGIFIVAAAAFLSAGFVLFLFLRPDPFLIAQKIDLQQAAKSMGEIRVNWNKKRVVIGAVIMIATQIVMVSIMTMTPLHMQHHGQAVGAIGLVIGFHIAAMYLPSLLTGRLVEKIGTTYMGIVGGGVLVISAIVTLFASGESLLALTIGLILLGIGWNFGLISGTTAVVDGTDVAMRPKIQSRIDVFIAISGASAGILSGVVVNYSSYAVLSIVGLVISSMLIVIVVLTREKN
ncbi:MFS transporter [Kurthia sibirica]|uniref:MFS transporter n=1 Tax=Kurthia sibirica TaxID=202750 RepID=A0A2U3ALL4_9BACL|nr:MFS transporter [Kurthia sibirica]PWI25428.1 MFS transporter [Kurthia sibirica]GEK34336.1 putative MFS-type transporter YdeG [Kurthia sibirica]